MDRNANKGRQRTKPGKRRAVRQSISKRRVLIKSGFIIKKRRFGISDARLQRGLIVLREKKELTAAARAARTTPERFKRAALRKRAIKKQGKRWIVKRDLARQMLLFTNGRELVVTVPSHASARLIGKFMSAVGSFSRTNDRTYLDPFVDRSVTDIARKKHLFETNPNVLHRLVSAGEHAFETIYRIVV